MAHLILIILHAFENMEGAVDKRSKNFTPLEEEILINILEGVNHILENKETNASSVEEKKKAWERVTELYNTANSVTRRTTKQLIAKYKNIKAASRKRIADEKLETYITGGGKKKVWASETDARLKASGAVIQRLQNPYDSDALYEVIATGESIFTLFLKFSYF